MSWNERIYADERLTHRARAVYMYLRDRADADGKCWPGVKRIASDLHLSRRTAQRALADLEQAGYIRRDERFRENGSRTSNLYTIQ
ncbi:MAG: helix-turn-helix domain-containing protein [Ruminococcaceae bacterium]|jgi:DNA-binding MarR family transcriptional regulator|nr:helix-turn-helix domain-containing protein [Oscillospiraceae bacterium]MBE7008465.1 helix-turn-helix domain-containing protein [Oscillospiraceae bacterium]